jgi:CHAD domain-containing protein
MTREASAASRYRLRTVGAPGAALRRVVREQIDAALADLRHGEDRDEAVHQARKRFRRIRSALRLVRDGLGERYRTENRRYRDLGRTLADPRDRRVLLQTLDGLLERHAEVLEAPARAAFAALREELAVRHRQSMQRVAGADEADLDVIAELAAARAAVDGWRFEGSEDDGMRLLERGLRRVYRRGRALRREAERRASIETLHEWRKRVKDLRHQLELLAPGRRAPVGSRASELHRLSDQLGDDHDLALLQREAAAILPEGDELRLLERLVETDRQRLQDAALALGRTLYAEKPKSFAARVRGEVERARNAARQRGRRQRCAGMSR